MPYYFYVFRLQFSRESAALQFLLQNSTISTHLFQKECIHWLEITTQWNMSYSCIIWVNWNIVINHKEFNRFRWERKTRIVYIHVPNLLMLNGSMSSPILLAAQAHLNVQSKGLLCHLQQCFHFYIVAIVLEDSGLAH